MQVLIVAARFNELITTALVSGAGEVLAANGIGAQSVATAWVPGAFEIPVVAARAARSRKYAAIICLGCVIRGETSHYDFVAGQAAAGIMKVSIDEGVPVIFGVLTTDTVEQAMNRAGLKLGNKGREAAQAALDMIETLKKLGV